MLAAEAAFDQADDVSIRKCSLDGSERFGHKHFISCGANRIFRLSQGFLIDLQNYAMTPGKAQAQRKAVGECNDGADSHPSQLPG